MAHPREQHHHQRDCPDKPDGSCHALGLQFLCCLYQATSSWMSLTARVHGCVSSVRVRHRLSYFSAETLFHTPLSSPLKQTSVYNVSLHPHAKFKSCLLKFDAVCTVSAFSLVQGYSTFSFVLQTIVVYSCLERCPCLSRPCSCWWASIPAQRCGCHFRPDFWTYGIRFFVCFERLSSGFTFVDLCASSGTSSSVSL